MYEKLTEAAERYGVSRSRLIATIVELFVHMHGAVEQVSGTVKYQQSRPKEQWKKLHIVIPNHCYEFFDDVRKVFKKSFSYLVVLAAEKILSDPDEKTEEILTDKYWCGAYTSIHFEQNGLQYLLYCWGIPREKPEIKLE
jgi:hypothetical protein